MFVARVKHKNEGKFLLGTSTCMDLAVEQKEAVTEELYSALAQTLGSAYTAEVWLVASRYQYGLCSPNKEPARLHRELASWHITVVTNSGIFICFQQHLHILPSLLRRAIPSQKSLQTTLNRKWFISPAQLKSQELDWQVHRAVLEMFFKLHVCIHVTLDWPNFIGSLFSWVLDPPDVYSSASVYPNCLSTTICLIEFLLWK